MHTRSCTRVHTRSALRPPHLRNPVHWATCYHVCLFPLQCSGSRGRLPGAQQQELGWADSSGCPARDNDSGKRRVGLPFPENLLGTTEPRASLHPPALVTLPRKLGRNRGSSPPSPAVWSALPLPSDTRIWRGEALPSTEQCQECSQLVSLDRPAVFQKQGMAGRLAVRQ